MRHRDSFTKDIILVLSGMTLVNIFNLFYQLLNAHKLSPGDFASFNSLLAIFTLITTPLFTLQVTVAKYSAGFNAKNEQDKVKILLSRLFKIMLFLGVLLFFAYYFSSGYLMDKLKIAQKSAGLIVAGLLATSCIMPVFSAGLQGLELFGWFTSASIASGALKLLLALLFILLGFSISGSLAALLISNLLVIIISYLPLRNYINFKTAKESINFKEIFVYFFPVAITSLCFASLVNQDMILVKYFFTVQESAVYSIAQVAGKIFLFLPGAISLVMFPKTSGLHARQLDTARILKKSLSYAAALCLAAVFVYNLTPSLILKILTGKAFTGSISLGRLFSVSMSFFALLFVLISYFISIKDLRFIKYLVFFTILQFLAIILFHSDLIHVQLILCINSMLLLFIHLLLLKKGGFPKRTVPVLS